MSNSLQVAAHSGVKVNDATTRFFPISGNLGASNATEADSEAPVREGGVFSKLFVNVTANDISSATSATITIRLSRADTAVTVSYGTSQTGIKEDTTNTVTALNTDEVDYEVTATSVGGNHSVTVGVIGCQWAPTASGNCGSFLVCSDNTDFGITTQTNSYHVPCGYIGAAVVTDETKVMCRARAAFTASNFFIDVPTNGRSTDNVFTTRVFGGPGNQTVTFSSGQTGQKEDTTHTDSLTAGADYDYSVATGSGTGTLRYRLMASYLVSTASVFWGVGGNSAGNALTFSISTFFGFSHSVGSTTESVESLYPEFAFTAKELGALVTANTIATLASTIKLRNNGANGNLALSYDAAQTGLKNDSVNTDSIALGSGGKVSYNVIPPNTSGTLTITWIGVLGTTAAAVTITADMWHPPTEQPYPEKWSVVSY